VADKGAYRSALTRANWATAFASIMLVITFWVFIAEVNFLSLPNTTYRPTSKLIESLQVAWVTFRVAFVLMSMAFLYWLYRASSNLAGLGITRQIFSPRWAIIWWFVPIGWFFKPYQVVKEIWQTSDPSFSELHGAGNKPAHSHLFWWWSTWILSMFLTEFGFGVLPYAPEDQGAFWDGIFHLIGLVLFFNCAVLMIAIIRGITKKQEQRNKAIIDNN